MNKKVASVSAAKEWTCPKHDTKQLSVCIKCQREFKYRTPAEQMTVEERALALEAIPVILTIKFSDLHKRIEELVGRPVWTHELGTGGIESLVKELRSQRPATIDDVMNKIPSDKRIIVNLLPDA